MTQAQAQLPHQMTVRAHAGCARGEQRQGNGKWFNTLTVAEGDRCTICGQWDDHGASRPTVHAVRYDTLCSDEWQGH